MYTEPWNAITYPFTPPSVCLDDLDALVSIATFVCHSVPCLRAALTWLYCPFFAFDGHLAVPSLPPMPSPFSHSHKTSSHLKSQKPDSELSDCLPLHNWLTTCISANTPPPSNPSTHLCLAASLLHMGSQMSLSTATSLANSVMVNTPMTRSTLPATQLNRQHCQWRAPVSCSPQSGEARAGDGWT